jgi:hypothetical protein
MPVSHAVKLPREALGERLLDSRAGLQIELHIWEKQPERWKNYSAVVASASISSGGSGCRAARFVHVCTRGGRE